jgi:hypothetical protein
MTFLGAYWLISLGVDKILRRIILPGKIFSQGEGASSFATYQLIYSSTNQLMPQADIIIH